MKYICLETFQKPFVKWALSKIYFRTLENLRKYPDVSEETHIVHSCYGAGWEKYQCHLPRSEEHLLIYQGRQLCDDKQALSVLVNFKLIVRCF